MNIGFYTSPLSFGICATVNPYSKEATNSLNMIEPHIKTCNMPECNEKAVRVGVFEHHSKTDGQQDSEFRGLCERHNQIGIWNNQ